MQKTSLEKEKVMSVDEWRDYIEDEDAFNEIKERLAKKAYQTIMEIPFESVVDYHDPLSPHGHGQYTSYIKSIEHLKEVAGEEVVGEINKFVK